MRIHSLLLLALATVHPANASTSAAVLPVQIVRGGATTTGTCALIHREDRAGGIRLYFVTAGGLFRTADGLRLAAETAITVGSGVDMVRVDWNDVVLSATPVVDVALLRVVVARTNLVPGPIGFDPPSPPGAFVVSGFAGGQPTDRQQRTRFVSTVLVVGDRDLSGLDGCLGSAASADGSMFGVVTGCEPRKAPIITLFRAAAAFLERVVPGLRSPRMTTADRRNTFAWSSAP